MSLELIYVGFHRPTGSAWMAPVERYRGGPTYHRQGPAFLEGDTPVASWDADAPRPAHLPTSARTTDDAERALDGLGWRTITRLRAAEVWRAGGGLLPPIDLPGTAHILTEATADERTWAGDDFTVCAFAVPAPDAPKTVLVRHASDWVPQPVSPDARRPAVTGLQNGAARPAPSTRVPKTDPPPSRPGADRPRPSPALDAAALTDALRGFRSPRRHPAEVTADRLGDHLDKWPDAFDGADRDAIAHIRHVLQQIADNG